MRTEEPTKPIVAQLVPDSEQRRSPGKPQLHKAPRAGRSLWTRPAILIGLLAGGLSAGVVMLMLVGIIMIGISAGGNRSSVPGYDDPYSKYSSYGDYGALGPGEFQGEARIGGAPMTSGTFDNSGSGAHVIGVDGEVLTLPPY